MAAIDHEKQESVEYQTPTRKGVRLRGRILFDHTHSGKRPLENKLQTPGFHAHPVTTRKRGTGTRTEVVRQCGDATVLHNVLLKQDSTHESDRGRISTQNACAHIHPTKLMKDLQHSTYCMVQLEQMEKVDHFFLAHLIHRHLHGTAGGQPRSRSTRHAERPTQPR